MNAVPSQLTFADASEQPQVAVISGGTNPIDAATSNAAVATVAMAGYVAVITPVGIGTATITFTDSSSPTPLTCTLAITVVSTAASLGQQLVDYLGVGGTSPPSIIFSDLEIQESYPGIIFDAQEVGGEWCELREINGDFWLVTNAAWDGSAWGFVNSSLDAYALKLGADGAAIRYKCAAATSPFAWTAFWQFDSAGDLANAIGTTLTSSTQIAHVVSPVWNTVGGTPMRARVVNVTDTSSPTASLLDDLQVGGVSKWSVRKDGVLIAGTVPIRNITGFRSGNKGAVPVDAASLTTVSISPAFAVSLGQVLITPIWGTLGDAIVPIVTAMTTQSFSMYCAGGPVGGLCTVNWFAVGNDG